NIVHSDVSRVRTLYPFRTDRLRLAFYTVDASLSVISRPSTVHACPDTHLTPTPPTPPPASPTIESTIITTRSTSVVLFTLSRNFSWDTTAKLFSCPGRSPRATRSATVTSSIACSVVAESVGPTRKLIQPFQ